MYLLEEGNSFQIKLFEKETEWNNQIGKKYPSLEIAKIYKVSDLKSGLNFFKETISNEEFRNFILRFFNSNRNFIMVGEKDRGDLELDIYNTTFLLEEFKAFLVYKCPIYYKKYKKKRNKKLAIDGLFLELKEDGKGNYFYEVSLLEVKLSENIWPSYIVQTLIYWINLNEFFSKENFSNFFKLKKEIYFVLGKKQNNNYQLDLYNFPFEDASFRLKQIWEILLRDFEKNLDNDNTPPIKPLCYQGEKCEFLNDCFRVILEED